MQARQDASEAAWWSADRVCTWKRGWSLLGSSKCTLKVLSRAVTESSSWVLDTVFCTLAVARCFWSETLLGSSSYTGPCTPLCRTQKAESAHFCAGSLRVSRGRCAAACWVLVRALQSAARAAAKAKACGAGPGLGLCRLLHTCVGILQCETLYASCFYMPGLGSHTLNSEALKLRAQGHSRLASSSNAGSPQAVTFIVPHSQLFAASDSTG